MINLDNLKIVYHSVQESLDYFVRKDDKAKINEAIEMDDYLSVSTRAVYDILKEKLGYKDEDFSRLAQTNFCNKAMILLPRMFFLREPQMATKFKRLMLCARNAIDVLGSPRYTISTKKSTAADYKSHDRKKVLREFKKQNQRYTEDELIEKIREEYTNSVRGRELQREFADADDRETDNTYRNKMHSTLIAYGVLERDEKIAIAKMLENRYAIPEFKHIGDKKVFEYDGVFMSPSVVRVHEENPELYSADDLVVSFSFQTALENASRKAIKLEDANKAYQRS